MKAPPASVFWVAACVAAFMGCGPRTGYLEVTLPFAADAEGLSAQVRVVRADGSAGAVSPNRLVDAMRADQRYSVEVTGEPFAMTLEVCLCEDAGSCFLTDGTCRGVGRPRGGLYRFAHSRTGFVGERTRWTANLCPTAATACALRDLTGGSLDVAVDRCAVEGCCPFCMSGRYCSDPAMEVHRCE